MNKSTEGFDGSTVRFYCELMRVSGDHYGLGFPLRHDPTNQSEFRHWAYAFGDRKEINECVLDILKHDMDALDGAAQGQIRIKTPELCVNLGVLDWWDSITANGTTVKIVSYGNKWTDASSEFTLSAKYLEMRDNQIITEIQCDSAASASRIAEQLRNNQLWEITLGDPVLQIVYDDGLTVHAFGLSDAETAAMSKTHELVGPCRWERGISISFGKDTNIVFGRPDSLLRFVQLGRTVELRGPARSATITYLSEDAAAKAFHGLKTKPRSREAVGDNIKQIYCQTRNLVFAEGISTEERERLDTTCIQIMQGQWRLDDCC